LGTNFKKIKFNVLPGIGKWMKTEGTLMNVGRNIG
jgi:hypothetical protein